MWVDEKLQDVDFSSDLFVHAQGLDLIAVQNLHRDLMAGQLVFGN